MAVTWNHGMLYNWMVALGQSFNGNMPWDIYFPVFHLQEYLKEVFISSPLISSIVTLFLLRKRFWSLESHHRGPRSCWGELQTWTREHAGGRSVANRALPGPLCYCLASPDKFLVKDEDVCSSPRCSWVRVDVFICTPHFQKSKGKSFCHCWHQNAAG